MDLNELLAKWAEKEPKRCIIDRNGAPVVKLGRSWSTASNWQDVREMAFLEYALRQSIGLKGWTFTAELLPDGDYLVTVFNGGNVRGFEEVNQVAAIALLIPYLQALEAS